MSRPRQRSAREPEPETSRAHKRKAKLLDPKEEQDDYSLLLSVTVVLVQNGWIGAREIGRLGTASRGTQWDDGEIWPVLCYRSWPSSARIPRKFVRALGGYRSLYRHRSTSLLSSKEPEKPPLPPPKMRPKKFGILIDIFVAGQSVFSDFLHGTELMNNLLKQGSAWYEITKPFVLGSASCWRSDAKTCTCKKRCLFDLEADNYDARIHLLRSTDKAFCCVFVPTKRERGGEIWPGDPKDGFSGWKNVEEANVHLRSVEPKGLTFRQTATAAEIIRRLEKDPVSFGLDLSVSVHESGDKIAITGFQVKVLVGEEYDIEDGFKDGFGGFDGVTVLHLLEQLQGVQAPTCPSCYFVTCVEKPSCPASASPRPVRVGSAASRPPVHHPQDHQQW